jgi:hypothetical protein
MPTFRHGKNASFKVDNAAGTLTDISTVLNEVTMPRSIETGETTSFGSGAKSYVSGLSDATISISGTYDATVDAHLTAIIGSADLLDFEYGPEGTTSTRVKFTGTCILTSYEVGSPVGDVVTFSAEFQVSGAITRGAFA